MKCPNCGYELNTKPIEKVDHGIYMMAGSLVFFLIGGIAGGIEGNTLLILAESIVGLLFLIAGLFAHISYRRKLKNRDAYWRER